jgi:SAM-dependent methyltransferase
MRQRGGRQALSKQIPSELVRNLEVFKTLAAVEEFSVYRLFPEEKVLFAKYYKPGARVLDLACGLGRTTLLLHEMGLSVRGIDLSEIFIKIAQRRFPYLDLRVGSFDAIEEPDASFSHVLISHNGLDYSFPESQRILALRECARVLAPGGTLIYSSHNLRSLRYFSPRYRRRLLWVFRNIPKALKDHTYILDEGLHIFYASCDYAIRQTEEVGLGFQEMLGFTIVGNQRIDGCWSPYVHYVFKKPIRPAP